MTFRANPHFNSPQMAQAAANLASMFAPPDGGEASAWAQARARQEDATRRQAVYDMSLAPDYNQEQADRAAAAAGVYLPTQSWRAVEMDDAAKRYGFDSQAATGRYGHDRSFDASRLNNADDNTRALQTNRLDNQRQAIGTLFGTLDPGQQRPEVGQEFMDLLEMPSAPAVAGAPKPLSADQWQAGQNQRLLDDGQLTDEMLLDTIMGGETPVKAFDPRTNQPAFMSPGAAVRQGAQPYEAASAEKIDNYLAAGPEGEEIRFPGYVGPDGRIVNANTKQVVPNVIRREGTGGGINFETDGEGGVRFTTGGTGNTVSQTSRLQDQRDAAARSARELQGIFNNLTASDVGVAGNLNQFLTDYGAQVWPEVARGDVVAMRTKMQATTMGLARSLAGDSRISDTDRRMAQDVMAGQGLGESLPGARAKIAALTVLHAYREKFAGELASGGEPLPPIDRGTIGQLVDDGAISPALANEYVSTMLSGNRGGPTQIPGSRPSPAAQTAPQVPTVAPAGVDPADWEFMTPEQKALFQ